MSVDGSAGSCSTLMLVELIAIPYNEQAKDMIAFSNRDGFKSLNKRFRRRSNVQVSRHVVSSTGLGIHSHKI